MDSGEYESTKRTGTFDRRLFDNKVFKLELKPLAADASLDQVKPTGQGAITKTVGRMMDTHSASTLHDIMNGASRQ